MWLHAALGHWSSLMSVKGIFDRFKWQFHEYLEADRKWDSPIKIKTSISVLFILVS